MADRPQVDPETEDFPQGPAIGEAIPHFELPDQSGDRVVYGPDGSHKSLILFHRSADW